VSRVEIALAKLLGLVLPRGVSPSVCALQATPLVLSLFEARLLAKGLGPKASALQVTPLVVNLSEARLLALEARPTTRWVTEPMLYWAIPLAQSVGPVMHLATELQPWVKLRAVGCQMEKLLVQQLPEAMPWV